MMMSPNDITHETFSTMERFNILYNRNNKEDIPPTKNALMLRTLSVFHDAYCEGRILDLSQIFPASQTGDG